MKLETLETPVLVLDAPRMEANVARMHAQLRRLGVNLRPHVKTAKCAEVAELAVKGQSGAITVSTLAEAEFFAARGVRDILYAVGLAPNKIAHVLDLRRRGVDLSVITDNIGIVRAAAGTGLPMLIEIDCDGHRSGMQPDDPGLEALGGFVSANGCELRGVMTHAGSSYSCRSVEAIRAMAEQERRAVVGAAERLRKAGLPCPVVSVGSTPTATFAERVDGITEVRAGVFVFFDLVMAGISVCRPEDIAVSVLTSVIGHQAEKGWTIVDAGWMALSRDRGTAAQPLDQGYGLVCDLDGRPLPDIIVKEANQEHGVLAHRSGGRMPDLPVGTLLRILPNHACATAGQYSEYHVVRNGHGIEARWQRLAGR
jgi:D-serine deaminase-like pyridoxal phosphate-dependent protein